MKNFILSTDSYKASHFLQYPPGTTEISSYIEARGGGDSVTFFGLQAYLRGLGGRQVTREGIAVAEEVMTAHGVPFNKEGWLTILNDMSGRLPLEIQAIPEGMTVPIGTPLVQVRNTHPDFAWLTSYIETSLLRGVWYPTTVATISRQAKKLIRSALVISTTGPVDEALAFKLHDFGARGVSSSESAALGGMAHLVNFKGSDTIEGILAAREFYDEPMAGFSIPAAEHSTITTWGKDGEIDAYRNMLTAYPTSPLIAVVSDSYNIYNACENIWGGVLKEKVERLGSSGRALVIRPDSGDPCDTLVTVFDILFERFGYTTNKFGYRELPSYVRVIQGDGINLASLDLILKTLLARKISIANIAFGMGGGLLQKCDRDTFKFAMKANEAIVDGTTRPVYKQPIGDASKASKKYRQGVYKVGGQLATMAEKDAPKRAEAVMRTVWRNGDTLLEDSFATIRARAAEGL